MIEKIWKFPEPIHDGILADMDDFRGVERQILFARDITDRTEAETFLNGVYSESDDPFLLHQMDRAVERVNRAIERNESIVIYGDYDADGVTSSAILTTALRNLGGKVISYFPDRFKEGYGLNIGAIDLLANQGCSLLITVDCGVRAISEVDRANEHGIDVIITDHHYPGASLPNACAVVNPRQPGDEYPFKLLAGVGVAYKLIQALRHTREAPESDDDLDLVAIGTVADIVPLVGENRILVRRGLEILNKTERLGLKGLIDVTGYQPGLLDATAIGFGLGPRINAAGRLKSARLAFDLLISDDQHHAKMLAEQLDQINRERQEMTRSVVDHAFEKYEGSLDRGNVIIDFDEHYHEGVVGLAASKLTEAFYRPTIIGRLKEDWITASARSIPGFHITKALEQAGDLMDRFGGHSAAAGLRIHRNKVSMLQDRMEKIFLEEMEGEILQPILEIDGAAEFSELDDRMIRFHDRLAPFGAHNQRPILVSTQVKVANKRVVGAEGRHLKLTLEQGGRPFDAIAFQMGDRLGKLTPEIDVAYRLERNTYLGYTTLQLNVADIRPTA